MWGAGQEVRATPSLPVLGSRCQCQEVRSECGGGTAGCCVEVRQALADVNKLKGGERDSALRSSTCKTACLYDFCK